MAEIASQSLSPQQIELLVEKAGGQGQVRDILSGDVDILVVPVALGAPTANLVVVVSADLDFEARIARGNYGWRHVGLTEERFPVAGDALGKQEHKLFHFNRSLSSEDAARLIREDGFEPARIADILAFGETSPHTQRRHPVVGLGSTSEVDGKGSAPSLWFDGDRRTLDLIWLDGDWHRNYRFLGVRPCETD